MVSFVQTNIDFAVSVTITYDEDFKKYLTMIKFNSKTIEVLLMNKNVRMAERSKAPDSRDILFT